MLAGLWQSVRTHVLRKDALPPERTRLSVVVRRRQLSVRTVTLITFAAAAGSFTLGSGFQGASAVVRYYIHDALTDALAQSVKMTGDALVVAGLLLTVAAAAGVVSQTIAEWLELARPLLRPGLALAALLGVVLLLVIVAIPRLRDAAVHDVTFPVAVGIAELPPASPEWNTGHTQNEERWFTVVNSSRPINDGGELINSWSSATSAWPGDVVSFQIFAHNNVCNANDVTDNDRDRCPALRATNAYIEVTFPRPGDGVVAVKLGADNAATLGASVTVRMPPGYVLLPIPGTVRSIHRPLRLDTGFPDVTRTQTDNGEDFAPGILSFGDVLGGYAAGRIVMFQATVAKGPSD